VKHCLILNTVAIRFIWCSFEN